MPAERYYLTQDFHEGAVLELDGQEFHHLCHVMRNQQGDVVEVVNGKGQLATARIDTLTKKAATLSVAHLAAQTGRTSHPLVLVQAIPRMNRLEFILEKSTELGVDEIWLMPAAHSEKKELSEHQLHRLEALLVSAMKQCGRLWLPLLKVVPPIKKWKELPMAAFFGDTDPAAPLFSTVWQQQQPSLSGTAFFVGPESGFNSSEVEALKGLGAQGVKLHQNILRTDTAALAALSLISHWQLWDQISTPL